ncbi:MAG: DUF1540 domain-containing protein [Defluviitaleaceae bacterium]|nr:DUF1540 domain-containing protein [Defluviitaleaceae bacterium]
MSLKCQSFDCIYNDQEGDCFAQVVKISGGHAITTTGTMCSSFLAEGEFVRFEIANEFMNEYRMVSDTSNIKCGASNCRYNANAICTANEVIINDTDASCETFET